MSLFYVQNDDKPMWVIGKNYEDALKKYKEIAAKENECTVDELEPVKGIQHICEDDELIL